MRSRLGGIAVAVALGLGACGSDGGSPAAPDAAPAPEEPVAAADLASARDTLPPAPSSSEALTVVLTHPAGALDAGLDVAAATLAQRPDIRVVIAATGEADRTASGFPVDVHGATSADAVATALDGDESVDLVVVGVLGDHGIGVVPSEATAAVRRGVPALVVGAEQADPPDHAAASMQLLEVLDLEVEDLLRSPATHRLVVPTCEQAMLRGRVATRAGGSVLPGVRSDCASSTDPARVEAEAFLQGYATLTRIP